LNIDGFVKSFKSSFDVIPAKAEIQCFQIVMDACLRRACPCEGRGTTEARTFYEFVKVTLKVKILIRKFNPPRTPRHTKKSSKNLRGNSCSSWTEPFLDAPHIKYHKSTKNTKNTKNSFNLFVFLRDSTYHLKITPNLWLEFCQEHGRYIHITTDFFDSRCLMSC
jgi:hypothetical protein